MVTEVRNSVTVGKEVLILTSDMRKVFWVLETFCINLGDTDTTLVYSFSCALTSFAHVRVHNKDVFAQKLKSI